MQILRFKHNNILNWGIVENKSVIQLANDPFNKIEKTGISFDFSKVKLLVPTTPSKIVLVGLNYKDHAKELGMDIPENPIIFLKPLTTLIADSQSIIYPDGVKRVDYEAELAIVIKKQAKNIPENEVKDYILGYTCLNDVTARDIQKKDGQWSRAKSYDTFCPTGPWIKTDLDPSNLKITAILNGNIVQESNTNQFIFSIEKVVSFISSVMTLNPGDIISTGTPAGIGSMKPNDIISIEIESLGTLTNNIIN